jgi:ATP-binding cassette subfamily B protein
MQTLDMRSWRQSLAVVAQEPLLFDGSVRDNVCYGLASIREDLLHSALRDAHCLEFVEHLPQGVDTLLGAGGSQLSGGQRQRLAIARALIRNPRVLVLDEPSSALDSASEQHVQQALERLRHGRTTLIVAHRLSTIQSADRIAVMADGQIIDIGSHSDLQARCPLYQRLSLAKHASSR